MSDGRLQQQKFIFIHRGLDKEDVLHIYMEYYSAIKRKEIVSFAAAQMDLEII